MPDLPVPCAPAVQPDGPWGVPQRLLQRVQQGLPLDGRPFDTLGAPLGLDGDTVIDQLRQWVGQGRIACIGLVWSAGAPVPADPMDAALFAACASGLPLLRQPYEALGAMLGLPARQVQQRLGDWLRDGRLLRIAAQPSPTA